MTHLLDRRRAVARTTLLVHVTAVVVLLVIMAGTEGPAAHGSGTSATLAKLQLLLLAVAGLVQIFMTGRWTRYALTLRQLGAADATPRNQWERSAYLSGRTGRGAVRVLMTLTVAAAWLAEIGCVPAAVYQVEHGGRGEPNLDFTIGMVVLFMTVTVTAAMTAGSARLSPRSPGRPRQRAAEITARAR
jgi:hypothetical protein